MKQIEDFKEEIEAIKLAIGTIQYSGGSIRRTVFLCLEKYIELYKISNDKVFLENALLHMQAFLEMGFIYEEFENVFDTILNEVGLVREEIFPKRFYHAERIKLVRGQVRKMIHRWSPSKYHSMTINEVVDDIIVKVKKRQIGNYFYHSNQNPKKKDDDIYELVITEEECFFYDIIKKKYYVFVES